MGEVEIIAILILFLPSIENIFEAIPDSAFIPAPISETLAMSESESDPSAFNSLDKLSNIVSTSFFCSLGEVKLISVLESLDTF